jgi:hypothetical protein
MFNKYIANGKETNIYYHKTGGGAEYLTDSFIEGQNGHREGTFKDANLVIRIDGGEIEVLRNNL